MACSRYSRRHYEQFAAVIQDMAEQSDLFSAIYVEDFAAKLVATFERDNPRFNATRFYAATGLVPPSRR